MFCVINFSATSYAIIFLVFSLEFEIPPNTQKGEISTVEGFLMTAAKQLGIMQEERLQQNPEVGAKVQTFVQRVFSHLFIQELE